MTAFQPVPGKPEAHPTRDEYVLERAIAHGRWVVESGRPAPTPEQAEADGQWVIDQDPDATYRIVCRTITSTVARAVLGTPDQP